MWDGLYQLCIIIVWNMFTLMQPLKELIHIRLCRYLSLFEKVIEKFFFRIALWERHSC